jgi:mRNA interferase HigB
VRIIKPKTIEVWSSAHAAAKSSLANWMAVVRQAEWKSFADLRQTFSNADQVKVASGRTVIVFNIAGNRFRLIAAVHYVTDIVFALRFLTHAEYSKDKWKDEL